MTASSVSIIISGRDAASKAFHSAAHSAREFGSSLMETKALIAEGIFGIGLVEVIKKSVEAFAEQEQSEAKLNSVLASTGSASQQTSQELIELASELQHVTKFADETTIAAEAILASFKHIKGEQFTAAVRSAQDLTTIMGGSLESNIKKIGKALDDPVHNLKALSKAGVSFTEDEKALMASMVATGDVAAAQDVIITKLTEKFGGAAEAAGSTFSGQVAIAKNSLNDLGEMVGGVVSPSLAALAGMFKDTAEGSLASTQTMNDGIEDVGQSVVFLADTFDLVKVAVDGIVTGFNLIAAAIANVLTGAVQVARILSSIVGGDKKNTLGGDFTNSLKETEEFLKGWTARVEDNLSKSASNTAAAFGKMGTSAESFQKHFKESRAKAAAAKAKLAGMGGEASGTGGGDDDEDDDEEGGGALGGKKSKDGLDAKAKSMVAASRSAKQIFDDGAKDLFGALMKGFIDQAGFDQAFKKLKEDFAKATIDPLDAKAKSLIKANQTAAESFHEQMDELRELRSKGKLTEDQFRRLSGVAKDKFDKANTDKTKIEAEKKAEDHKGGTSLLESRFLARAPGGGINAIAKAQLDETKRANTMRQAQAIKQEAQEKKWETARQNLEQLNMATIA